MHNDISLIAITNVVILSLGTIFQSCDNPDFTKEINNSPPVVDLVDLFIVVDNTLFPEPTFE